MGINVRTLTAAILLMLSLAVLTTTARAQGGLLGGAAGGAGNLGGALSGAVNNAAGQMNGTTTTPVYTSTTHSYVAHRSGHRVASHHRIVYQGHVVNRHIVAHHRTAHH